MLDIISPLIALISYSYSTFPTLNSISYTCTPSSVSSSTLIKLAPPTPACESAICFALSAEMVEGAAGCVGAGAAVGAGAGAGTSVGAGSGAGIE